MFSFFINIIKHFYKKEEEIIIKEEPQMTLEEKLDKLIHKYSEEYSEKVITPKDFDPNKPSILVVDDNEMVKSLYAYDFRKVDHLLQYKIKHKYNVIYALGNNAGILALQYIIRDYNIKIAILDLSLGNLYEVEDDIFIEIDGVDVAMCLEKYLPEAKYRFITAHNIEYSVGIIEEYINKSDLYLKKDIRTLTINKIDKDKDKLLISIIKENDNAE